MKVDSRTRITIYFEDLEDADSIFVLDDKTYRLHSATFVAEEEFDPATENRKVMWLACKVAKSGLMSNPTFVREFTPTDRVMVALDAQVVKITSMLLRSVI